MPMLGLGQQATPSTAAASRCKPLLGELHEAETAVNEAVIKPTGLLRVQASLSFEDVVAGRLVPVLTEWELQRLTINVAYPTRRHLPAKVRYFVRLVEQFAVKDFERRWTA